VSGGIALAVLGDPLAYTRSPALHRAGLDFVGLAGSSAALRTSIDALPRRLDELAAHGYAGANLTTPLKRAALARLDRIAEPARRARSVNTIGFAADGRWGETTDGPGFLDLLGAFGRDPARERVWILGGGGAARSVAWALCASGASVSAFVRSPDAVREHWEDIEGARLAPWGQAIATGEDEPTLVVNATPLGEPLAVDHLPRRALVVDLRYGREITPWIRAARAAGLEAHDGLGLLVFQARRSLSLWLSRPVSVDPLARAVGWSR
jgi:shikimate dehydrogenase